MRLDFYCPYNGFRGRRSANSVWFWWELSTDSYTERYFKAMREGKIVGYMFEQQNYIPKPDGSQK